MPVALALFDSPAEPRKVGTLLSRRGKGDASSPNIYNSIHLGILDKDKKYVQTESIDLADLPIENYKPTSPILAVSPEGKWLAVACGHEHAIRIYDIAKQVTRERRPTQTLKSKGKTFHEAFFVSQKRASHFSWGRARAILLGSGRKTQRLESTNLEGRAIRPDSETKPYIYFGDGWKLTQDPKAIQVRRLRSNRHGTIRIDEGYLVTTLQWLPPKGDDQTGVPIVAVALLDENQSPQLYLYDGSTGKMVGWLNGHIDTIRSLAFFRDKDTTWLVSASDDQTVCIWNLGVLRSPAKTGCSRASASMPNWKDKKNTRSSRWTLAAPMSDPGFSPRATSSRGRGNERVRFQGPGDLWKSIKGKPLKDPVKLIRRRNGKSEAVNVTLAQEKKEIKPELTLFLMPKDEQTEEFSWVAWKPSGQYDFSLNQEDPKGRGALGLSVATLRHRTDPWNSKPLELKSNERADSPWWLFKSLPSDSNSDEAG